MLARVLSVQRGNHAGGCWATWVLGAFDSGGSELGECALVETEESSTTVLVLGPWGNISERPPAGMSCNPLAALA